MDDEQDATTMAMATQQGKDTGQRGEETGSSVPGYILEAQVGFMLRRAHQRASGVFNDHFKDLGLSPVQFAALTKIADEEPVSQNQLGRLIHMDPATTMAMINRLCDRGLVSRQPDPGDLRRIHLRLPPTGRQILADAQRRGLAVTNDTLAPLAQDERVEFLRLLEKLT